MMASEIKSPVEETAGKSQLQTDSVVEGRAMLALEGMTCASCAMRIEKGLKKVPGVKAASVNLATEKADVTYDPAQTSVEQLVLKVEAVGYKATPHVAPTQETLLAGTGRDIPAGASARQDEQSRPKQAELIRKRNLLLLGTVFSLPVVILP